MVIDGYDKSSEVHTVKDLDSPEQSVEEDSDEVEAG
jgi:hypothetical protein